VNHKRLLLSLPARIAQHLVFWGLAYYILVRVFASSSEIQVTDHLYTMVFVVTIATCVYLNLLLLIPFFLNRGKYLLHVVMLALCLVAVTLLNQFTFSRIIDYILPGYYFISYFSFTDILKFMVVFTGITSLLKLSKGYFLLLESRNELVKLQKERTESELMALRAQVNPHFLFNSLNSIYALVLKHSGQAPETILKLSDLLRYVLYETRRERVALSAELEHMQQYVALQGLRSGPDTSVHLEIQGEPGTMKIAPLLFLPLIENSFKHGIKGATGPAFVNMEWTIEKGSVRFLIENNKGLTDELPGEDHHGIGLENLRKRLSMDYPGKHRLEITGTESRFKAELLILQEDET